MRQIRYRKRVNSIYSLVRWQLIQKLLPFFAIDYETETTKYIITKKYTLCIEKYWNYTFDQFRQRVYEYYVHKHIFGSFKQYTSKHNFVYKRLTITPSTIVNRQVIRSLQFLKNFIVFSNLKYSVADQVERTCFKHKNSYYLFDLTQVKVKYNNRATLLRNIKEN